MSGTVLRLSVPSILATSDGCWVLGLRQRRLFSLISRRDKGQPVSLASLIAFTLTVTAPFLIQSIAGAVKNVYSELMAFDDVIADCTEWNS